MPELPEVETVRKTLTQMILGKTIDHVEVYYLPMISPHSLESFNNKLHHATLDAIDRIGKYLIFRFDTINLMVHLRMEGKFFLKPSDAPRTNHEHIIYHFTDGTSLRYDDVRKFGTHGLKHDKELHTTLPISKLGYEPSDSRLTKHVLKEKLKTDRAIKTALLDQTVILGLGNIYVDEVLFCAKINPTRKARRTSLAKCETLIECSRQVIDKAITLGGSSIRSYTDSLGVTGRFQNELKVHLKADELCELCQTPIRKIKVNGRGTYYCPTCQKR